MDGSGLLNLMAFVAGSLATIGLTRLECAPAPLAEDYVFVKDTERWVGILRGKIRLVGKLDANGDFTQTYRLKGPSSMMPPYSLINFPGPKPKKVYEFRSGRLIIGELTTEGNFVPEVDSTILKFEDYKYAPEAIPIWNLPGSFMKKNVAALQGKWSGKKNEETTVELVIKSSSLTWSSLPTEEGMTERVSAVFIISKIDSEKRPKEIDLTAVDDEAPEKVFLGIYKLDGDKLTIRRSQPGEARPKDFEAAEGDKNPILRLKKVP